MGRTLPSICEHGRMVDGGDFALSEHCPECKARVRSQVTVNAVWLAELQREHEAMQHDIERMQAREVELATENERLRARTNSYAKEFATCSQCQSCGRLYQVSEGCLPCEVRRLRGALTMIREITGQDAVFHEADSALEGR